MVSVGSRLVAHSRLFKYIGDLADVEHFVKMRKHFFINVSVNRLKLLLLLLKRVLENESVLVLIMCYCKSPN